MKILQLLRDNESRTKAARPVNAIQNGAEASLYVYGVISADWGVSAEGVAQALAGIKAETLHVYINSPGGDVFEGRAIMAELRRFSGKTIAHIDSLCASAATSIAMACSEVQMSDGAFFMIHEAMGGCFGTKQDMRARADLLEKVEGSIVDDYKAKTGKEEAEIRAWMDAETWFSAAEAKEQGFIDSITSDKKAKNTWNLAAFGKVPEALKAPPPDPEPEPEHPEEEPAAAGSFMSTSNANRLRLLIA
jgi:ATP-dependent protease ClpP protease subunit